MTTLRVIVDQILAPVPGGIGRYAEELTRALIETAPPGCTVEAMVRVTLWGVQRWFSGASVSTRQSAIR